MGRKKSKKKVAAEAEENTDVLDLEELDLDMDDDDDELSELELEDFEDEATVELELEEEEKPKKSKSKKKKKSASKSKKKSAKKAETKSKKKKASKEKEEVEDNFEDEGLDLEEEDSKPLEISLESPRQEATLVAGAMNQSMEAMAKQWASVKESSELVSKNFERVSGMLGELPASYQKMLDEMARNHNPRPTSGTKIAVGLSVMAIVFAGISLLFSQSVRQTVMSPVSMEVNERVAPEIAKRPEPPTRSRSDLSKFTRSTKKRQQRRKRKLRTPIVKKNHFR